MARTGVVVLGAPVIHRAGGAPIAASVAPRLFSLSPLGQRR